VPNGSSCEHPAGSTGAEGEDDALEATDVVGLAAGGVEVEAAE